MPDLNQQFEAIDLATIHGFVEDHRQEDLHLEFKTVGSPAFSNRDDRKNFAKLASGFANSDGGIIVWGIDARKDEDGVDAASGEVPIVGLHVALSRIQTDTGSATSPIVDGLRHHAIPIGDDDSGFLVTLVPASDSGPHMAKFGEDRYYKRSGDSMRKMEHFDLEDMFGRRRKPRLSLVTHVTQYGGTKGPWEGRVFTVKIIVGIENSGRGIARFPLLELEVAPPHRVSHYGLDGNGRTGLPGLVSRSTRQNLPTFAGGVGDVIHPGMIREITALDFIDIREVAPAVQPVRLKFRLAAEGVAPIEDERTITANEILAATPLLAKKPDDEASA